MIFIILLSSFTAMARFHKLKVKDIRRETVDCVSVSFEVPANLKEEYRFLPGQYLTIKIPVTGEDIRRSYSICSGPFEEEELRVAIKKVKGGKGSGFLNESLKNGQEIEVMIPMGNFHSPLSASNRKKYFLFAGGSGITPMLSIIKAVLRIEQGSELTLFYGNLDPAATIFKRELDSIAASSVNRLHLHYIYENAPVDHHPLCKGRMDVDRVRAIFDAFSGNGLNHEFFICGPGPMMDNVMKILQEKKTPATQTHIEYFTAAVQADTVKTNAGPSLSSRVTVSLYGIETTFELSSHGKSVLDAALDAGVDVPFACKGAVCCTCRGRLLEGKVKMDQNFALTESEVEAGYILTCQSHPQTAVLRIDYDA